ncbi:MAG: cyclic nucleotide-binding domain-containing protein, partial [Synechococcus sp.]
LEEQIQGQNSALVDACAPLLESELFSDLTPDDFLWLAQQGHLRCYASGDVVIRQGEASKFLAIVVDHSVEVVTGECTIAVGSAETIGEMGVITGQPRSATVVAGPQGVALFEVPSDAFEDLLQRSPQFNRGLLRGLAKRINPEPNQFDC